MIGRCSTRACQFPHHIGAVAGSLPRKALSERRHDGRQEQGKRLTFNCDTYLLQIRSAREHVCFCFHTLTDLVLLYRTSTSSSVISSPSKNSLTSSSDKLNAGNDSDQDSDREPEPPVEVADKPSARFGKRDAPKAAPAEPTGDNSARGGRGGRRGGAGGSEGGQ